MLNFFWGSIFWDFWDFLGKRKEDCYIEGKSEPVETQTDCLYGQEYEYESDASHREVHMCACVYLMECKSMYDIHVYIHMCTHFPSTPYQRFVPNECTHLAERS